MKRRLLFVITGLGTGGAETMLVKLLSRLDRQRFEPHVVSLADGGTRGAAIQALGIPLTCLGMRRGMPSWRAMRRLRQVVADFRPDLVQGWMYHGNLVASLAARFCAAPRPPVFWSIRQTLYGLKRERPLTRLVIRAGRCLSDRTAGILYNSRLSLAQHTQFGYAERAAQVVVNGFDTELFRPDPAAYRALRAALGLPASCLIVGMVARWHPMKDHASLLAACGRLWQARPDVAVVLVGAGMTEDNPALAALLPTDRPARRLFLLGERRDIPALQAAFDVATLSSAWGDAFPNTLGEAMSCGVPCVSTDVGDASLILGETGQVVPVRQPDALADAWLRLLALPAHARSALGAAARRRIVAQFGIQAVVERFGELYEAEWTRVRH